MKVPEQVLAARETADRVYGREQVVKAIDQLSVRLTVLLAEENPLLVCVLHGGLPFTAALMQRLHFPLQLSCLQVSRYGDATAGGALTWQLRPSIALVDRHVVLVDDIVDEGVTLESIVTYCREQGARAVTTVALLDKRAARRGSDRAGPDFAALDCPDRYVFGWGMDYQGYWRNLPDIWALSESGAAV